MKRIAQLLLLSALLTLVACVRPFQEDEALTMPPNPVVGPSDSPMPVDPAITPTEGGETAPPEANTTPDPAVTAEPPKNIEDNPVEPPEGDNEPETETEETSPTIDLPTDENGNPIHTVKSGETMLGIAILYGVEIDDVLKANGLSNPDSLSIDQELIIPTTGQISAPAAEPETEPETEPTVEAEVEPVGEQTHVVVSGDTLYSIGQRYGFTVDELIEYNNLVNPERLAIGDEILIPPSE